MSEVRSIPRLNQTVLYDNLVTDGKLKPMDIDGVLDYHGRAWLVFEYKLNDANVSTGQGIALQRLADDLAVSKKPVLLFVLQHSEDDTEKPIYVEECIVRCLYWNGEWITKPYQGKQIKFGTVYHNAIAWFDAMATASQK